MDWRRRCFQGPSRLDRARKDRASQSKLVKTRQLIAIIPSSGRKIVRPTSRTYIATLLMLVACFLFAANFASAQGKKTEKMGVTQIVPAQGQDGVIDQEI